MKESEPSRYASFLQKLTHSMQHTFFFPTVTHGPVSTGAAWTAAKLMQRANAAAMIDSLICKEEKDEVSRQSRSGLVGIALTSSYFYVKLSQAGAGTIQADDWVGTPPYMPFAAG